MSTARVDFTRGAAERIARVVRLVEQGERDQSGPTYGRVVEGGGGGITFRICTYTGAWSVDSAKTITFFNQTSTPNTVVAHNLFATLAVPTASTQVCAIHKYGTAWYLIASRCS